MGIVSYKINQQGRKPLFIMVESDEHIDGIPREAALSAVVQAAHDFKKVLFPISAVANAMVNALKSVNPGELMIEFGIELGGSAGIPLITKHEGKANFKVQLKWKPAAKRKQDGNSEDS